jgi:hypothetical protein
MNLEQPSVQALRAIVAAEVDENVVQSLENEWYKDALTKPPPEVTLGANVNPSKRGAVSLCLWGWEEVPDSLDELRQADVPRESPHSIFQLEK